MNGQTGLLLSTVVLTAVLLDVLGRRVRHGVYFGVTTGAEFAASGDGRRLARRFRLWTWAGAVIAALIVIFAVRQNLPTAAGLAPFVQVVAMAAAWIMNWRDARPHAIPPDTRRVAALDGGPGVSGWFVGGAALSVTLLTAAIAALALNYDLLPDRFPTHYGLNGQADAFKPKSPSVVFAPPVIGLLVTLMMYTIMYGVAYRTRRGGSPDTYEVRGRQRRLGMRIFGIMGLLLALMFTYISSSPLLSRYGLTGGPWIMVVFVAAIIITAILTFWKWVESPAGAGDDTPDDQWKLGMFYFNSDDPAWVVPRRDSIGYTINFAHPFAWVIVAITLGISTVTMLLSLA